MNRPPALNRSVFTCTILLSFIFHVIVLWFIGLTANLPQKRIQPTTISTSKKNKVVPLLSEREINRILKRIPPKEKDEEERKKDRKVHGQIVEIPPPPLEEEPDNARFLSEFNQKVKREIVHKSSQAPQNKMKRSERQILSGGDDEKGQRKGRRGVKKRAQKSSKQRGKGNAKQSSRRVKNGDAPPKVVRSRKKKMQEIMEGQGIFQSQRTQQVQQERGGQGTGGGRVGGGILAPTHYQSLLPTLGPQDQQRLEGSIDHVDEIKKGDRTALNTREYRYAFFFNRVKREVSRYWRAAELHRAYDPTGKRHGVKDRQTVLAVTLRLDGSIAEVSVLQKSGLSYLDQSAVDAFRGAEPFHQPPRGLADPDGLIRFNFGFFLEIGGGQFRLLP